MKNRYIPVLYRLLALGIVLLAVCGSEKLYAQNSYQSGLDSLFRDLATKPPDVQMALLVPAWEKSAEFSVARSEALFQALEGLAGRTTTSSAKAYYLRAQALSYYYRNRLQEVFIACSGAMELLGNNAADSLIKMQVLFVRGRAYQARGELANAVKDFNAAMRIAKMRKLLDKNKQINALIARLHLQKGLIDQEWQDVAAAEQNFLTARLLFRQLQDRIGVALADIYLGDLYTYRRDYVRAESLLQSSLRIFLKERAYHHIAQTYLFLGNIAIGRDAIGEALEWYNQSIAIDSANHKLVTLQDCYLQTAGALARSGNYENAFRYINEAKKIATNAGNQYALMNAHEMDAELYYGMGNFKQAFESQQIANTYRARVYNEQLVTEIAKNRTESAQSKMIDSLRVAGQAVQNEAQTQKELSNRLSLSLVLLAGAIGVILWLMFAKIKANKELEQKNRELKNKNERLDLVLIEIEQTQKQYAQSEKLAALGKLSGGIAHEILNPMNYIKIGTQQLEKSINKLIAVNDDYRRAIADRVFENELVSDTQEQKSTKLKAEINEFLVIIKSGVDKILKIIQSMRQLKPHEFVSGDIHSGLENALMMLVPQYPDIEVERRYEKKCPKVHADHLQLEQAFTNIIGNAFQAIKMAKRQHGKLVIKTDFFDSDGYNDKLFVRIDIQDNGIGMTEEVRQHIYEPFFSTKDVGMGTGLGLYITKQILDLHHARIDITSEPNVGTNFIIALPVE